MVLKTSKGDGLRARWETVPGRPAGSGLLSLHGAERLQESLGELDLDNRGAQPVRLVLLSLSALPEAFLLYLRGSKPTCPESSGLPGRAKGINTQCSMNLMYVSHIAFLISYIFIAVESNKLQYHEHTKAYGIPLFLINR